MSYRVYNNKLNILWPISILRLFLPLFTNTFLGQILLLFSILFDCHQGHVYISDELTCKSGDWYYMNLPLVLIALILLINIALLTNAIYFKSVFKFSKSDVLKKKNSVPDISLTVTKIIINLIMVLDKGVESEHWAIIFF